MTVNTFQLQEEDKLAALAYVKANQPCKAMDVAAAIGRSKNATRELLERDRRFRVETLDNGYKLFYVTGVTGQYDIVFGTGETAGAFRHRGPGSVTQQYALPEDFTFSLFAIQPSLIREVEDERAYMLQSPRLYGDSL